MIWLVNSSLFFYPITLQREFSNRKTQLCQGRTQWCQQITVQEYLFGGFVLVHLTFGSCTSPTEKFPFAYFSFSGPGIYVVDNIQRLIFGNSQSPEKFTGEGKTQIKIYVYICILHHLQGQWHIPISRNVLTCHWYQRYPRRIVAAWGGKFLKLTVGNRSQKIRSEKMVDQLSSGTIGGDCRL